MLSVCCAETPTLANPDTSVLDAGSQVKWCSVCSGSTRPALIVYQKKAVILCISQDATPEVELNLCIKDEPQDEEYDRALAPFNTEGIKDEPYSAEVQQHIPAFQRGQMPKPVLKVRLTKSNRTQKCV